MRHSVAELIQDLKRSDALMKHASPALLVNIFGGVTGKAGDDLDLMRQEFRQIVSDILTSPCAQAPDSKAPDHPPPAGEQSAGQRTSAGSGRQ